MNPPPEKIGGAKVVCYSSIDDRHRFTGNCKQIVAGRLMGAASGLAICQYDGEQTFYLFSCDANWHEQSDTLHFSLEEAKDQGEFEYEGVSQTWVSLLPDNASLAL